MYEWIFSSAARVDHRPDVRVVLPAGPEAKRLRPLDEPRRERVVQALVDDHAARRRAALARRAERRPEDPVEREVEIGVVHDDDRVLAAELEVDVLEPLRRRLEHLDAGLARARERDHGDVGMAHEPVADGASSPVHDVDDALRDAGLVEELDEALAESGRVGRGLEDDGVPGDERGRDLPGRDRDREVPRRDHADDADRHPDRHLELVAELGRRRLPEEAPALAAHVVAHVDRFLDVAAGLGLDLPHLVRHEVGQLGLVLDERAARSGRGSRRASARARAASPRTPPSPPRRRGRRPRRRTSGRCRSARRRPGSSTRRSRRRRRPPTRRRCSSVNSRVPVVAMPRV